MCKNLPYFYVTGNRFLLRLFVSCKENNYYYFPKMWTFVLRPLRFTPRGPKHLPWKCRVLARAQFEFAQRVTLAFSKAGYTLPAWCERGVSVACQLRGGCVNFSISLHTRNVSDAHCFC